MSFGRIDFERYRRPDGGFNLRDLLDDDEGLPGLAKETCLDCFKSIEAALPTPVRSRQVLMAILVSAVSDAAWASGVSEMISALRQEMLCLQVQSLPGLLDELGTLREEVKVLRHCVERGGGEQ